MPKILPFDPHRREYEGEPPAMVMYEIDIRDGLTPAVAQVNAANFALIAHRYPQSALAWFMPGFDEDPRALVDIPEAKDFLRLFGEALEARDPAARICMRMRAVQMVMLLICMGRAPRDRLVIVPDNATRH